MNRREGFSPAMPTSLPDVPPPPPPPRGRPQYETSDEVIASEAYQHGRTQGRLERAREALARIANGQVRNMQAARAVARLGLEWSAEDPDSKEVNPQCPAK